MKNQKQRWFSIMVKNVKIVYNIIINYAICNFQSILDPYSKILTYALQQHYIDYYLLLDLCSSSYKTFARVNICLSLLKLVRIYNTHILT